MANTFFFLIKAGPWKNNKTDPFSGAREKHVGRYDKQWQHTSSGINWVSTNPPFNHSTNPKLIDHCERHESIRRIRESYWALGDPKRNSQQEFVAIT